ncbi:MAG TPA: hypothetical protein PKA77_11225, partial [Chitinophagaceae bacterium]|nr:hypothetical protein [Chitinophagaceae bacterium]HMU59386.1 hypothetical protein [Chitinophagaceae bacterium]
FHKLLILILRNKLSKASSFIRFQISNRFADKPIGFSDKKLPIYCIPCIKRCTKFSIYLVANNLFYETHYL